MENENIEIVNIKNKEQYTSIQTKTNSKLNKFFLYKWLVVFLLFYYFCAMK